MVSALICAIDGGDTIDCSMAVIKGGVMMSDGCYYVPTFQSSGTVYQNQQDQQHRDAHVRTGTTTSGYGRCNRAGGMISAIAPEKWCARKRLDARICTSPQNMKRRKRPLRQPLWYCDLREQWDIFYKSCEFEARLKKVEEFNARNRWRKRGISMVPLEVRHRLQATAGNEHVNSRGQCQQRGRLCDSQPRRRGDGSGHSHKNRSGSGKRVECAVGIHLHHHQ